MFAKCYQLANFYYLVSKKRHFLPRFGYSLGNYENCAIFLTKAREIWLIALVKVWHWNKCPITNKPNITLAITKLIDFYSQGIFTFLFATVFNWKEPERQLIAKLIQLMGSFKELSSLCSGLQNFFWFRYKEHKMCLTKIPTYNIFKLLSVIYFQNMWIVTCDF